MAEKAPVPFDDSVVAHVAVEVQVPPDWTGADQFETAEHEGMTAVEEEVPPDQVVVDVVSLKATVVPLGTWLLAEVTVAVRFTGLLGVGTTSDVRFVTELLT